MAPRAMPPIERTALADANGNATLDFADPSTDYAFEQLSVSTNGVLVGQVRVLVNDRFVIGSAQALADSADGEPPIYLGRGSHLKVVFSGIDPGAQAYVYLAGLQDAGIFS